MIIQTRWHEDDLAGRLLAEMASGGEHWEVVSLPAEAEPNDPLGREVGEMLWGDDDYGYANALRQQKAEQPAYNWSAFFQQRPAPETGSYFLMSGCGRIAWRQTVGPCMFMLLRTSL